MELANIEKLVEKYLNAETSLQEDQTLKIYFTSQNVAPHLQEYTYLFNYFKVSKQETFTKTIALETKKSKKKNGKWFAVAASIALLFSVFIGKQQFDDYQQRKEAERIYAQVNKGLQLLSSNLNKGEKAVEKFYAYENTVNEVLK